VEWDEVSRLERIRLNLGSGEHCHPHPDYLGFVAVDREPRAPWAVRHDLAQPIPLPAGSVERILSEHFLEHVPPATIVAILCECHRLLQPGGLARLAVPDYQHPRWRHWLTVGRDPHRGDHATLTTWPLLRALIAETPFTEVRPAHYWDGDRFVRAPLDYALGFVRRTPDNDPRNRCVGLRQHLGRVARDVGMVVRRGPFVRRVDLDTRRYHPLAVTSVVVDLVKAPAADAPAQPVAGPAYAAAGLG